MRNSKMDSMILLTIDTLISIHLYFDSRLQRMLFENSILCISKYNYYNNIIPLLCNQT